MSDQASERGDDRVPPADNDAGTADERGYLDTLAEEARGEMSANLTDAGATQDIDSSEVEDGARSAHPAG